MKICVVAPSLKMGGMERASANLANALFTAGIPTELVTLFNQGRFVYVHPDIVVHEPSDFNTKKLNITQSLVWLRRKMDEIRPDVVIVYHKLYAAITLLALYGKGIKIFTSERSSPTHKWPLKQEIISKIIYSLIKPTGIIAQTTIAKLYQTRYYGTGVPIRVIPNALREVRCYPDIQREKIVLAAGRLNDPLKGFDRLIEAFALIKNRDWKLVIAGGSDGEDSVLTGQIKTLGLTDRVIFEGKVSNLDLLFARASIFVIPSRSEGFPNALCEAMAAGLPCIAFDFVAGPKDIIEHGTNGLLVEDGNIPELARTIDFLMDNPEKRETLGAEATRIKDRLHPDLIVKLLLNFINEPSVG